MRENKNYQAGSPAPPLRNGWGALETAGQHLYTISTVKLEQYPLETGSVRVEGVAVLRDKGALHDSACKAEFSMK